MYKRTDPRRLGRNHQTDSRAFMTKFFTLLSGKEVRNAPGQKIFPAKEFGTLENAAGILKQVEEEALLFKQDTAKEAEKIKELAFQEGFQEGLVSLNQHL